MAKGKCINIGKPCDLAISEEIQDADPANFVCKECGKPLVAVGDDSKSGGDKSEGAAKSKKGLIIGICVAAVAAIGGGAWYASQGGETEEAVVTEPETSAVVEEETETIVEEVPEAVAETEVQEAPEAGTTATPTTANPNYLNSYALAYGVYSGPATDGVPDGPGGTIKVTKAYQLDLKAGGEMLDLAAGDEIVNCKFRNGKIVQGFLKRKNGQGRNFNIGI